MTTRKKLIFKDGETDLCGHRYNRHCEHPGCPGTNSGWCLYVIPKWCPLEDAPADPVDTKALCAHTNYEVKKVMDMQFCVCLDCDFQRWGNKPYTKGGKR